MSNAATALIKDLGYEQLKLLRLLRDKPDIGGVAACSEVDCSWDELFALGDRMLVNPGFDRLQPGQCHPTLTSLGRVAAEGAARALEELK